MDKWQKELDARLKLYEKDRKKYDALKTRYQAVVDACNAFTSGYAKAVPELSDLFAKLQDNSDNKHLGDLKKLVDAIGKANT